MGAFMRRAFTRIGRNREASEGRARRADEYTARSRHRSRVRRRWAGRAPSGRAAHREAGSERRRDILPLAFLRASVAEQVEVVDPVVVGQVRRDSVPDLRGERGSRALARSAARVRATHTEPSRLETHTPVKHTSPRRKLANQHLTSPIAPNVLPQTLGLPRRQGDVDAYVLAAGLMLTFARKALSGSQVVLSSRRRS